MGTLSPQLSSVEHSRDGKRWRRQMRRKVRAWGVAGPAGVSVTITIRRLVSPAQPASDPPDGPSSTNTP